MRFRRRTAYRGRRRVRKFARKSKYGSSKRKYVSKRTSRYPKRFGSKRIGSMKTKSYAGPTFTTTAYAKSRRPAKGMSLLKAITQPNVNMTNGAQRINQTNPGSLLGYSFEFLEGTRAGGATNGCTLNDAGISSQPNTSQDFFLESLKYHFKIYNPTNSIVTVYIYDLLAKSEVPLGDSDSNAYTCLSLATSDPSQTSGGTYSAPGIGSFGMSPFYYERFKRNWKVTKRQKIALDPGQSHEHDGYFVYNKKIHAIDYKQGINVQTVAWITRSVLFMIEGTAVNDATPFQSNVEIAPSCVDIVYNANYIYRWTSDNSTTYNYVTNSVNPMVAITTPQIRNDDSGAVNSYNTA